VKRNLSTDERDKQMVIRSKSNDMQQFVMLNSYLDRA